MPNKLQKFSKFFFVFWFICVLVFIGSLIYVVGIRGELLNETGVTLALISIGSLLAGILAFLGGTWFLAWARLNHNSDKISLGKGVVAFVIQPLFPAYYLISSLRQETKTSKLLGLALGIFVFGPIWLLGYGLLFVTVQELMGLDSEFTPVLASESMAPTIPGGTGYKYYPYKNIWYQIDSPKKYQFKRGDIVSFSTQRTKELIASQGLEDYNFVKRVVGIPGDTIEIKGGVVFLNDGALYEPYTLKENSTYAGDILDENGAVLAKGFINECQQVTVPEGSLFVLGDNRTHSDDSRIIGFVPFEDVDAYLPFEEQRVEYYHGVNRFKHDEKWRPDNGVIDVSSLDIRCQ